MYKIEFFGKYSNDPDWVKITHKFYEKEKTFEIYWKMHTTGWRLERSSYDNWRSKAVAYKNGEKIREIESP
jgi:hypothetical protein